MKLRRELLFNSWLQLLLVCVIVVLANLWVSALWTSRRPRQLEPGPFNNKITHVCMRDTHEVFSVTKLRIDHAFRRVLHNMRSNARVYQFGLKQFTVLGC